MAKLKDQDLLDQQLENQDYEDDLADDDYVFVIGADGKLKNVVFPPVDAFEYSDELLALFRFFGVDNPDALLSNTTIH